MVQIAKKGIRKRLVRLSVNLVQAIGYLFGFSLVAIFSLGLLHSEEFESLTRDFQPVHHFPVVFEKHGKYYLQARFVSLTGWIFVSFFACLLII